MFSTTMTNFVQGKWIIEMIVFTKSFNGRQLVATQCFAKSLIDRMDFIYIVFIWNPSVIVVFTMDINDFTTNL